MFGSRRNSHLGSPFKTYHTARSYSHDIKRIERLINREELVPPEVNYSRVAKKVTIRASNPIPRSFSVAAPRSHSVSASFDTNIYTFDRLSKRRHSFHPQTKPMGKIRRSFTPKGGSIRYTGLDFKPSMRQAQKSRKINSISSKSSMGKNKRRYLSLNNS